MHAEQMNGQTVEGFPYGIDPRAYGLGKLEYADALRHHRTMEDSQRRHHEHEVHMNTMAEADARSAAAHAELEAKHWWLIPATGFAKCFGGALGFAFWFLAMLLVVTTISSWSDQRSAAWCIKDVAKCEQIAKGAK